MCSFSLSKRCVYVVAVIILAEESVYASKYKYNNNCSSSCTTQTSFIKILPVLCIEKVYFGFLFYSQTFRYITKIYNALPPFTYTMKFAMSIYVAITYKDITYSTMNVQYNHMC
jgi:hypothetical protein